MGKSLKNRVKQERERAEFQNFVHISGRSFDSFASADEPEPDIVAQKGRESFGIEITKFHRREVKQRESEEDHVIERAAALYSETGGPHLDVSFMWAPHYRIRKDQRTHLADRLAFFVRQNAPAAGTASRLDWRSFDSDLMVALDHVSINRLIDFKQNSWHAARGGFVPCWDAATLQDQITQNDSKPKRYAVCYTETWLLIVSAFGAPSAWMEMRDDVKETKFRSAFDRVFLLSSFPLAVFQLHITG